MQEIRGWAKPAGYAFTGGATIGLLVALIQRPEDDVFLTNSWSYVPKDQWWLHAIVVGVSLAIVLVAMRLAQLFAVWLFQRGLLISGVGTAMLLAGVFMLWLALFYGGLDRGQRIMFGAVMGPFFIVLGGAMVWSAVAARRQHQAKQKMSASRKR